MPPPDDSGDRRVLIAQKGTSEMKEITLDSLLFSSDAIHGHGTTVWATTMDLKLNGSESPPLEDTWSSKILGSIHCANIHKDIF